MATDGIERTINGVGRRREEQVNGRFRGVNSLLTCPDCGGVLWQVDADELLQFCCHVGHVYTGEALMEGLANVSENQLWTAIRTLSDQSLLARQLAAEARNRDDAANAENWERLADKSIKRSEALRRMVMED